MIPRGMFPRFRRKRFQAPYPSREFLIVRWLQLILLALLAIASGVLSLVSYQKVRMYFVVEYGVQAYLLPAAALLVALFLIFRFFMLWRIFREERNPVDGEED